jgi:hypothetical protein
MYRASISANILLDFMAMQGLDDEPRDPDDTEAGK